MSDTSQNQVSMEVEGVNTVAENCPVEIPLGDYGDMHKIVLQGVMAAGFLDLHGVKRLFNAACDHLKVSDKERQERTSMPFVQQLVLGINEQVKPFDMAIRSTSCEITGKKYFIFMVMAEKSLMKHQIMFAREELAMLRLCMDRILTKYFNFSLPLQECINIWKEADPDGQLKKGEDFVKKMMELQYFTKFPISKTEYDVTMGMRGLREFELLLVETYGDVVQNCCLCKAILLHGFRCPTCKLLTHRYCFLRYRQTCRECPSCSGSWGRKDMLLRNRVTDEIIASKGPDVDLSQPFNQFVMSFGSGP